LKSALIAAGGLTLVFVGNAVASGDPLEWKTIAVAAGSVFVNAVWQRLKPHLNKALRGPEA
jgi:hypothetical protein